MSKHLRPEFLAASAIALALGFSPITYARQAASAQPSSAAAPETSPPAQRSAGSPETSGISSNAAGTPENGVAPSQQVDATVVSPSAVPQSPVASPATTPSASAVGPNQQTPVAPEGNGVVTSTAASDGQSPVGAPATAPASPVSTHTIRGGINNANNPGVTSTPTTAPSNDGVSGALPTQGSAPTQGNAPAQGAAPTF